MTTLWWEFGALLVYGPAVVLLHELGHALFARPGGFRVAAFGIGLGKPFARAELSGGMVVHLDRWLIAGGTCTAVPVAPPTARRAWFHGGGLILQALLAGLLLALPDLWPLERVAQFNLMVFLLNALPWRLGGSASDGWYLLDLARGGRRGAEVLPRRPLAERVAQRARAVGSRVGQTWAELSLAWADVLAGRPDDARDFFERGAPEVAVEPWVDALYHYVHAQWHRAGGRPLAALRIAREARILHEDDDLDDAALGLITLTEAQALADLDEPAAAQRILSRIAGLGGLVGRQAAAVHLAASLDDEPEHLEYAAWRVIRRVDEPWLDPTEAILALWHASDELTRHGRRDAAQGAREAARVLARRTLETATPTDRVALMDRLAGPAALGRQPTRTGERGR